jgi:hypothetical protein
VTGAQNPGSVLAVTGTGSIYAGAAFEKVQKAVKNRVAATKTLAPLPVH